jgi:hypothetical protein
LTLSGLIQLAALVVVFGYPLTCVVFPYRRHRPCRGRGEFRSMFGIRMCAGCAGTGRTLRLGARVFEAWTRRRHR